MAAKKAKGKVVGKNPANPWEDHYTRLARKEAYAARSVYKLKEIHTKYDILKEGARILDLGCAPGSWLQYAAEMAGSSGDVLGVDLKPVLLALPPQARAVVGDIYDLSPEIRTWIGSGLDVVLSDMAPATTGMGDVDALRSAALSEAALFLASEVLLQGGHFVCKIFQGRGFDPFVAEVRRLFEKERIFKPQSCRKQSREIYVIGLGFQGRI
ncbi:RlmE family RNA methyltransferase [Desulfobotulus sp.]|jgi:23S rRNA (uridine2552-2'-O)-methyltransferase|uniref:RlmE family RNA methyltransferase n=1 Tax=Desulfobotulus sp. TaxID=1940337 RepID=UPI002A36633B|nr:RlmE family RNA methyltransferase [Desulfobotulus sp.]MDY0163283.1 RlmE family RNA methyltransferase [Desulfobotulus sp.]